MRNFILWLHGGYFKMMKKHFKTVGNDELINTYNIDPDIVDAEKHQEDFAPYIEVALDRAVIHREKLTIIGLIITLIAFLMWLYNPSFVDNTVYSNNWDWFGLSFLAPLVILITWVLSARNTFPIVYNQEVEGGSYDKGLYRFVFVFLGSFWVLLKVLEWFLVQNFGLQSELTAAIGALLCAIPFYLSFRREQKQGHIGQDKAELLDVKKGILLIVSGIGFFLWFKLDANELRAFVFNVAWFSYFILAAIVLPIFIANRRKTWGKKLNRWEAVGTVLAFQVFESKEALIKALTDYSIDKQKHGTTEIINSPDKANHLFDTEEIYSGFQVHEEGKKYTGLPLNAYLRTSGQGHALTIGANRSGKGTGLIVPFLLQDDYQGSQIILDVKGELAAITARYRSEVSDVYILDPFDYLSRYNPNLGEAEYVQLNPFDMIRGENLIKECKEIAEYIIPSSDEDNHFKERARKFLVTFIAFTYIEHERDADIDKLLSLVYMESRNFEQFLMSYANLSSEVREKEGIEEKQFPDSIVNTKHGARTVNRVKEMAQSMLNDMEKGETEYASVIATLSTFIDFLQDPEITESLSPSTLNRLPIEDLRSKKITVYIVMPPEKLADYYQYIRLVLGACILHLQTHTEGKPVLFLLDEFPLLRYMRSVAQGMGALAGYNVQFWVIIQGLSQIKIIYRDWDKFVNNAIVIHLLNVGETDETSSYFHKKLGNTSYFRGVAPNGKTEFQEREAMTILEIENNKDILVFMPKTQPLLLPKAKYYEDDELTKRAEKNPLPTFDFKAKA